MKSAVLFLSLLALLPDAIADETKPRAGRLPAGCEVVMSPGMRITATTPVGTIAITAIDELTRSYTWDGATRAVEMSPRANQVVRQPRPIQPWRGRALARPSRHHALRHGRGSAALQDG